MSEKNGNHPHEKKSHVMLWLTLGLLSVSGFFVWLEVTTHFLFFGHIGAIPLEILAGAFLVERFLESREKQSKLQQLMYIKSYLFRSEMRNLFIRNFEALIYPDLTMANIRQASLEELKVMRANTNVLRYKSLESIEPLIMEYVNAHGVFYGFMEWAIENDFEPIFQDMIYILHFIQDVRLFKKQRPDEMFVYQAEKNPQMMNKVKKVIKDGIEKFIDYAIELKEKQPEVFEELLDDYMLSSSMNSAAAQEKSYDKKNHPKRRSSDSKEPFTA